MRNCNVILAFLVVPLVGCSPPNWEHDPLTEDVFTGEAARDRILSPGSPGEADPSSLPASSTEFYLFDGGTFNGTIKYWSFRCGTVEDCWAALTILLAPPQSEFQPWQPSQYAVVMKGPAFYWPELATDHWDIESVENGAMWEKVDGDRRMEFYAVDFDTNRIYYHKEGGGFPTDAFER